MTPVTQADFDQLATFVAVADELSMEPFVSDDNHERLVQSKKSDGAARYSPLVPSCVFEIGDPAVPQIVAAV